jgi:biotin operon repressor
MNGMEHISDALKDRNIILEAFDPVVADGFTQVPNFILKNDALTVGEKITFAMFLSYAWNNDKVFPGQERLASDIGVTRQSVSTFIKGLEKKGFLTIKRRGLGQTNIYTLRYRVMQHKSAAAKQGRKERVAS